MSAEVQPPQPPSGTPQGPIVPPAVAAAAASNKALVAGVMYVISLLIGLGAFFSVYAGWQYVNQVGAIVGAAGGAPALGIWGMFSGLLIIFVVLFLVGVVGSLIAVIFCFTKKKYGLAVLGGVLAFVGLHFLFGLIGFVFLMRAKPEFAA